MLLAKGCKVFTENGFTPVECLEGKTVEINCLPYSDMCSPLQYCTGVLQEAVKQNCFITKSIASNSSGFISFPLYKTTNFLCCNLTYYNRIKNPQPFTFLNTINSLNTTAPLLVRNMVVHTDFKKYGVYHDQYELAVNGIGSYLELFYQLYNSKLKEDPYQSAYKFILQTDIQSRFLQNKISKNTFLPKWDYTDNEYLREYYTPIVPYLIEPLKALSHLTGFIFSVEDDFFKLYFTRLNTDRIDTFMPSQYKNIKSIIKKRSFLNRNLSEFFKKERDASIEDYNTLITHKSIDFHKNSSRVVRHRLKNYYEDTWEVGLQLVPLKDRSAIYWNSPYINLPLEYFKDTQWYNLNSATPRLVYVESPSGLLFLVSTIGEI